MSKIYLALLDKKRLKIFQHLSHFKKLGYLAGGTALALQINHRKSVDFDVFVYKPIGGYLRLKIEKIFGKVEPYVNTSDQISFKLKEDIGVTFVWYWYKLLYPPIKTESLKLAHIFDIAADKAHTLGRRAVWRDYVDFFFLLKEKFLTIEKIVQLAEKKFGSEFNEALFLQQLTYFKDVGLSPTEFIKESYSPLQIKSFLEKEVRRYLKKRLR